MMTKYAVLIARMPLIVVFTALLAVSAPGVTGVDADVKHTARECDNVRAESATLPPLRFGMSAPLTGPSKELGRHMRGGVLAAFEEVNREGGIRGRRLELIVADDGYEPSQSAKAVRHLVEQEQVLALVGCVGTPTAVVNLPIALKNSTPYVGAYTGARVLRPAPGTPLHGLVFNFRASYAQEIGAMIDALIEQAGVMPHEIGFFTQRDTYGDSGYEYGMDVLRRHGLPTTCPRSRPVHARYERNTMIVEPAVADMLSASVRPRAVIMVGTYAPTAKFVRLCRESGFNPIFLSVSFVGSRALAEHLGSHGDGVIITQVVPPPDSRAPVYTQFEAALRALPDDVRPVPSMVALEGYCVGRMLVKALTLIEGKPCRESLRIALEGLGDFDLGLGQPLRLDEVRRQASQHVWPSIIRSGSIVSLDWTALRSGMTGVTP
jgi:ABC-type branched-subunit amino acid transport system substrate-binding protein